MVLDQIDRNNSNKIRIINLRAVLSGDTADPNVKRLPPVGQNFCKDLPYPTGGFAAAIMLVTLTRSRSEKQKTLSPP